MGIVRTSGTGREVVYAGDRIDGGARGVVSAGDAMVDDVFDMVDGDDACDVDLWASRVWLANG